MTNLDVYHSALALAAEVQAATLNADYLERAPFHLASICSGLAPLDLAYRKAHDIEGECVITTVSLVLSDAFPLCDVFAPAVSCRLAALLTLDENEILSEKLAANGDSAVDAIRKGIPAVAEPIKNAYPGLI